MKNEIRVIANLSIKGMDVIKRCYSGGYRSFTHYNARWTERTQNCTT